MEDKKKESPFEKGVKLGYILSYKNPKALQILIALSPEFSKTHQGLIEGKKQFERHQSIISVDEWKQQERKKKLKEIQKKEKEIDKDELER